LRLALEIGDGYDYLTSQYYRAWALLLAGRWDELLAIVTDAIEMGERNGSAVYQLLFRLILAALHLDTFGAVEAAELAQPALVLSRSLGYRYGQMLALVLLGSARTALGKYREAETCYSEVQAAIESQKCPLDWMMQMRLLNGLSRLLMARGDLRAAHDEATKLLRMAEQPGERTFMGLASCTLSRVAMSQHRWDDAEANLAHALRRVDDLETPVAAWPVLAAAAELYNQRDRKSEAATVSARSAAIVQRLATVLPAHSRFRETFLCSDDVQIILALAPRHPHINAAH